MSYALSGLSTALFLFLAGFPYGLRAHGAVFLSEVMANPSHIYDAEGEFLELGYGKSLLTGAQLIQLDVNGQLLEVSIPLKTSPGIFLICKDSSNLATYNIKCQQEWPSLSLTNSGALEIELRGEGFNKKYTVPASKDGKSWENSFPEGMPSEEWVESSTPSYWGDFASPGYFHPAANINWDDDIILSHYELDRSNSQINIYWRAKNLRSSLSIQWNFFEDVDLDAMEDVYIKNGNVSINPNEESGVISLDIPGDLNFHSFVFRISGDLNNANNFLNIYKLGKSPISITEICFQPPEGVPEWFEIYNSSENEVSLQYLQVGEGHLEFTPENKIKLGPGQYALLSQNRQLLSETYPDFSSSIYAVSPWNSLRNSEDSISLKYSGALLTLATYSSQDVSNGKGCLEAGIESESWVLNPAAASSSQKASPGYQADLHAVFQPELSSKIIDSKKSNFTELRVQAALSQKYHVSLFDFNGVELEDFGEFSSAQNIKINHQLKNGKKLLANPYIVLIELEGSRSYKLPLVVR